MIAGDQDALARPAAHRLAIFNHKGGVGKTTLTVNIGAALAARDRRVLLVDTDPQCNLTSYLVATEVVDDLLDKSDGPDGQTVWSSVKPISEAMGNVRPIEPIELSTRGLFLLPGDIRLSEFEIDLNNFWSECLQRKLRGFRGTTAISDMVTEVATRFDVDYVLYDSGPNIGSLNRAILLDCDRFIVPVAADLFSLRALSTLGRTLVEWITSWTTIADLAPEGTSLLPGRPTFFGYIPEGFRTYAGDPTQEQSRYLAQIERAITSQVVALLRDIDHSLVDSPKRNFRLGQVKNFGALAPASRRQGTTFYAADAGSPQQRSDAYKAFSGIAKLIDEALSEV